MDSLVIHISDREHRMPCPTCEKSYDMTVDCHIPIGHGSHAVVVCDDCRAIIDVWIERATPDRLLRRYTVHLNVRGYANPH